MTPCSILIALDKFKGSLTAEEACAAAARGFRRAFPQAEIRALPIADGGEGTAAALRSALGGEWGTAPASDALGRPVESRFALIPNPAGGSLAVLEMSEASGLWRIGAGERDPRRATTFGTGQMLRAAAGSATEILIGIGGSATNDGGSGMAQALGFRFLDAAGEPIADLPAGLDRLARLDPPADLRLPPITVACDVDNPLLGEAGATRVYGPQKGVRPGDFGWFEARLARFADCAEALAGRPLRGVPGAGAAGGLGFALIALCGARLRPGFAMVAEALRLREAVASADLVVTGEGRLDAQTLEHGKGPAGVARMARDAGVRCAALCGSAEDGIRAGEGELFSAVGSILGGGVSLEEAMAAPAAHLAEAAQRLASSAFP